MKRFLALAALVFVGVLAWRIGSLLSSDALGMAVGIVFGMLAGIPAALLVLATGRRATGAERDDYDRETQEQTLPAYPYQPPVIVVTGGAPPQYPSPPQTPALPPGVPYYHASNWPAQETTRPARQFRVVGEREDWLQ